MKDASQKGIFDDFTNKYSLSKTLRFELKPVGETLVNMREHLKFDEKLRTFLIDQEIENAYFVLKPVFDHLHECFITESLESEMLRKEISFSEYFKKYGEKKDISDKDERTLLRFFEKAYEMTGEKWKNKNGKGILKEKGFKILTEKGILKYIEKNISDFSEIKPAEEIKKALESFAGFFTYFTGFNKNRENYYETKKETGTAVASRIIYENLPKFCDNILFFEERSEEYKKIYAVLRGLGRTLTGKEGKPLSPITGDIFNIAHFNKCFSQKQIELYNEQIGNANFLINLYNQIERKEKDFKNLHFFKTLYKQIACGEKQSLFFTVTHDKKDEADKARGKGKEACSVEEVLNLAAAAGKKYFAEKSDDGIIDTVPELLDYIKNLENYFGLYWSKVAINTISGKYFANWEDLKNKMKEARIFQKSGKENEEIKIPEAVELEKVFNVLNDVNDWKAGLFKTRIVEDERKNKIILESASASKALLGLIFFDVKNNIDDFLNKSGKILGLVNYKDQESREEIKDWLENALTVNQILKYFLVKEGKAKGEPVDSTLANTLKILLESEDARWFKWYDGLRNYLTRKPQDDVKENKLKLNFENSTLGAGWDLNKEPENSCVIFRDSAKRKFLGIIARRETKGSNNIFVKSEDNLLYKNDIKSVFKKMEYKLLPGPNKMLPKCLIPGSNRKKYGATDEILGIYDNGSFKKNEKNFSIRDMRELIDFYKTALNKYEDWSCFKFSFKPMSEYKDISQFYNEVEKQGYKLGFIDVNKTELDKMVKDGRVYLFEIKNQDSNDGKKDGHKNNLHTMYWDSLFDEVENRPRLNGGAEIFYRKALSADKLKEKIGKNGKKIIENFRFSKEKFLFHVPITLNSCSKAGAMNDLVKEKISNNKDVRFLGIDRGEKHLAYYSLVDKDGKLIEQGTLNLPFADKEGNPRVVKAEKRIIGEDGRERVEIIECRDYNQLLDTRAGDRDYARKNWQIIGTIKNLKEGYISQAVRAIADLATKEGKPTYIVLEALNTGFKRSRQKIEKSVYQKLEVALVKKLNFLVDKTATVGGIGSVTKAIQLTPEVKDYGDIENRKQVGIVLYTRPNYTSLTDPITGWRKSLYLKKGSEDFIKDQIIGNEAKKISAAFFEIGFDGEHYFFAYKDKSTGKSWRLYSGGNGKSLERFHKERDSRGQWISESPNIGSILDEIFVKFDKSGSLLEQMRAGVELAKTKEIKRAKYTAWESLRFTIDLIQQIRNSGTTERDGDFLLSPVRDPDEKHFDSRVFWDKEQKGEKVEMPSCGDAAGAFNIARKGIIMNEHIKNELKLYVPDEEWDAWLAGERIWNDWIKINGEKQDKKVKNKTVAETALTV